LAPKAAQHTGRSIGEGEGEGGGDAVVPLYAPGFFQRRLHAPAHLQAQRGAGRPWWGKCLWAWSIREKGRRKKGRWLVWYICFLCTQDETLASSQRQEGGESFALGVCRQRHGVHEAKGIESIDNSLGTHVGIYVIRVLRLEPQRRGWEKS